MAQPAKVELSTAEKPQFYLPSITDDSAKKASELLQENHERHHIFFNQSGFHNHIVHHLLTIYSLGVGADGLQKAYDVNKSYQRPQIEVQESVVEKIRDPAQWRDFLGQGKYYSDFLTFFQEEIEKKGWKDVVNEYAFKGDERADDMLVRLYAGFLHPIIHLGFGIEFQQPAIIAEALAQTAVHDTWVGKLLLPAEAAANELRSKGTKSKSLVELLDAIYADKKLSTAADWDDGNKVRDGILVRAPQEMINIASQYFINDEDDLDEKVAEMTNAVVYYTGAAQHPPKQIKYDFYFMHCLNSSIFFPTFLKQDFISRANKIRLLEWKARLDLAMYASRRSPKPLLDEVTNYRPKEPSKGSEDPWAKIFERVGRMEDDGHSSKLVRALAHGQRLCKPYESKEEFRVKDSMWLQLGHMAIDSVEDTGNRWVRSAGFDEAWVDFADRPRAQL